MTYSASPGDCLTASIVLYHSPVGQLRSTLESLFASAQQALINRQSLSVQLTVVDNSGDASYEAKVRDMLDTLPAADFFEVKFVATARNLGFGGGHNVVVKSIDSEFHLILNPDVEVGENALHAGISSLEKNLGITLLSPAVRGSSDEPEYLCKSYPSVLVLLLRAFAPIFIQNLFRARLERYDMRAACSAGNPVDILLASGCFMLMRSAALKTAGGFDERYFMYFEDFDFSLRIKEQGRLVFEPSMQIRHHGGYAATKGANHILMFVKSGLRFFNDHGWKWI